VGRCLLRGSSILLALIGTTCTSLGDILPPTMETCSSSTLVCRLMVGEMLGSGVWKKLAVPENITARRGHQVNSRSSELYRRWCWTGTWRFTAEEISRFDLSVLIGKGSKNDLHLFSFGTSAVNLRLNRDFGVANRYD
jgi:hypothetical protein